MYKRDYSGSGERPFNFAQLLLERLDKLFQRANESRVDGDPFTWYKVLSTIITTVSFKLTTKELGDIEKELVSASGKIKTATSTKSETFYFAVEKKLNDIEKMIIKLMYNYKLYYPHYEVKGVDDEIVEGYE